MDESRCTVRRAILMVEERNELSSADDFQTPLSQSLETKLNSILGSIHMW